MGKPKKKDPIIEQFCRDTDRLMERLESAVFNKVAALASTGTEIETDGLKDAIHRYNDRRGPAVLLDLLGFLKYADETNAQPHRTLFDILHDLEGDKWTTARTEGYVKHLDVKPVTCSKCEKPRLARDIIYCIPRDGCAICPDWNICVDCWDKLDQDYRDAIEQNSKVIKCEDW